MRIVDPTFGIAADEPVAAAVHAGALDVRAADTLCVFSNSKPNANELLAGISRRLEAERGLADIGYASKPNAAAAADTATIDWLAAQYRMAIVAIGD